MRRIETWCPLILMLAYTLQHHPYEKNDGYDRKESHSLKGPVIYPFGHLEESQEKQPQYAAGGGVNKALVLVLAVR